jgi:hypothetical protein
MNEVRARLTRWKFSFIGAFVAVHQNSHPEIPFLQVAKLTHRLSRNTVVAIVHAMAVF